MMTRIALSVTTFITLLVGRSLAVKSFASAGSKTFANAPTGGKFLAKLEINSKHLEDDLLAELRNGSSNVHVAPMREALRPMFEALPKTSAGTLSHKVVQYALARFFADRHGWLIRGIQPTKGDAMAKKEAFNASRELKTNVSRMYAEQVANDWMPSHLQTFLEKLVAGHGVSLQALAILAATLEDLVHEEEKNHLFQAYAAFEQPTTSSMQPERANQVLRTYMMIYMLAGTWTPLMAKKVDKLMKIFKAKLSHWDETVLWLEKLVDESERQSPDKSGLNLEGAIEVTGKIGKRFATHNDEECASLKRDLLKKESSKPGRIRLVDFYRIDSHGGEKETGDFKEKVDFLRAVGTLDDSDPETPLVIIPNYVQARSNCLVVSGFYSVCCPNECEPMMQLFEREIERASARPYEISNIYPKLSSPTVRSPGNLSQPLMKRLHDIAAQNGGEVPLHGRLFAQWMHHAFPRECPFPFAGDTAKSQTHDEWVASSGQVTATLSSDEIQVQVAKDSCRYLPKGVLCSHEVTSSASEAAEDIELPWDSTEELLVMHDTSPAPRVVGALFDFTTVRPKHALVAFFVLAQLAMVYAACKAAGRWWS